jgi:hypothetical protein
MLAEVNDMTSEENWKRIEAAIKDLIVVSRTLVDHQKDLDLKMAELADGQKALIQAQMETERKLQVLIDRFPLGNA